MSHATLVVLCGDWKRRMGFVQTLQDAGWERVYSAPSLSEGTGPLRDAADACVIIDAELADMPGLRAAGILRGLCPHAKIIFTAPDNTRDQEAQVRALDVFYYCAGSADRAELVAAVADAIGAPSHDTGRRPPRILIVDDDPDFHATTRIFLEAAGYHIISAYSEQQGLEMARRDRPDAILLDIIMESTTDGFEFCHQARRDPHLKHTPILGISAIEKVLGVRYPPSLDPDLFPVDGYLSKPVAPERLYAELRRLIPVEV